MERGCLLYGAGGAGPVILPVGWVVVRLWLCHGFAFSVMLGFILCYLLAVRCQPHIPIVTRPLRSGDLTVRDTARHLLVLYDRKGFG